MARADMLGGGCSLLSDAPLFIGGRDRDVEAAATLTSSSSSIGEISWFVLRGNGVR